MYIANVIRPILLKRADVVSIPKFNPPRLIESDLRPISLTPVLSKQLESFIGNLILETISGKIDVNQYGGLRGTSTNPPSSIFFRTGTISYTPMKLSVFCMLILEKRLTPLIMQYC